MARARRYDSYNLEILSFDRNLTHGVNLVPDPQDTLHNYDVTIPHVGTVIGAIAKDKPELASTHSTTVPT